jgi:hypothetical protein
MTQRKTDTGFDFETLRRGIERCDPDLVLGLYAEGARLSIANAAAPHASPFELRGKAEIAKHLQAVFGQGGRQRAPGHPGPRPRRKHPGPGLDLLGRVVHGCDRIGRLRLEGLARPRACTGDD